MNAEPIIGSGIDDKKRFEVLLDALKDVYKEIIDTNLKIAGVLLIVLGWFASHKNPLSMLCQLRPLTYAALIFTVVGQFLLVYLFRLLYLRAQELYGDLNRLGYEELLFRRFKVTRGMLWCGLFGHFTMLLGIFALLYVKYIVLIAETCEVLK